MNSAPYDQTRLRRVLLGLALVAVVAGLMLVGGWLLSGGPARAAGPYTVNSLGDGSDANLGDGTCQTTTPGECTLRAAMEQTLNDGGGTIIITAAGTITLTGNLPAITETVVITGPGSANLTVNGVHSYTHFYVGAGVTAEISGLTLVNGEATCTSTLPRCALSGGTIHNRGTLRLDDVTITASSAASCGGAVFGDVGSVTIIQNGSRIGASRVPNTAMVGGGVATHFGTIIITAATVSYNTASGGGGGIWNYGGMLATDSTISNNHADGEGGGILARYGGGELVVVNSTVSGNTAAGHGGGIANIDAATVLTLDNSTIANNTADFDDDGSGDGGGI